MINKNVLEKTPLLFSLKDSEIEKFSQYLDVNTLKDKEILFNEGDEGNYLCIIAKGGIGIAKADHNAELKVMWELPTNKVFGELALFDGQPRSGTALAIGDTEVYTLKRSDFVALSEEQPALSLKISINVIKVLSNNLRTTTMRFYKAADALEANSTR
jgi:CRP-like cAMP-binding protein